MPLILSAKVQEQVIVRDRATGRVLLKVFPAEIRGEKVRLAFSADKDAIEINRLPVDRVKYPAPVV
jgi:sRNA-binding carbon storage regulator CsrA